MAAPREMVIVRTGLLGGASWIRTSVRFEGRGAGTRGAGPDL